MIEPTPSPPQPRPDTLLRADPEAWRSLVEACWPRMLRSAQRMLARTHDAEDACQEALLGAFQALSRFEPDRPFEPWLFGILNRVCLKRLRTRRRRPEAELPASIPSGPPPELLRLETEEERRALVRAIDDLPPRERFLIVARCYQGLSNQDIARTLEMTPNAVGVALHRAMQNLRRRVKAEAP